MKLSIQKENLSVLLNHFYALTNIRISVFGTDFSEILSFPAKPHPICNAIKSTVEGKKRCLQCDNAAQQYIHQHNRSNYLYTCHAGLIDSICPLMVDDQVIGYMMFGQCISDDLSREDLWQRLINNCSDFMDLSDMKEEFQTLQRLSKHKLDACAGIMSACSIYISSNHLIKASNDQLFLSIKNYIESHLQEDLSSSVLCRKLFIPRNELFRLIKDETGMSLGQYVKFKRLQYAQKLLQTETYSITDIAGMCGINDFNYFTRIFKQQNGVSPREYRIKYSS